MKSTPKAKRPSRQAETPKTPTRRSARIAQLSLPDHASQQTVDNGPVHSPSADLSPSTRIKSIAMLSGIIKSSEALLTILSKGSLPRKGRKSMSDALKVVPASSEVQASDIPLVPAIPDLFVTRDQSQGPRMLAGIAPFAIPPHSAKFASLLRGSETQSPAKTSEVVEGSTGMDNPAETSRAGEDVFGKVVANAGHNDDRKDFRSCRPVQAGDSVPDLPSTTMVDSASQTNYPIAERDLLGHEMTGAPGLSPFARGRLVEAIQATTMLLRHASQAIVSGMAISPSQRETILDTLRLASAIRALAHSQRGAATYSSVVEGLDLAVADAERKIPNAIIPSS